MICPHCKNGIGTVEITKLSPKSEKNLLLYEVEIVGIENLGGIKDIKDVSCPICLETIEEELCHSKKEPVKK